MLLEPDLDGAHGMAEIPEHERARGVRGFGDPREVGERAGPVRDVGEGDEPDVARGAGGLDVGGGRPVDRVGLDEAEIVGEALEHVAVGREVVEVGDDRALVRARGEHRGGQLVEVDGDRVGDDDLSRPCAERVPGELVADLGRELDPVVPAAHEFRSPTLDDLCECRLCPLRQPAERVAVDVERPALLVDELVAEAGERVVAVESRRVRRGHAVGVGSPSGAKSSGQ